MPSRIKRFFGYESSQGKEKSYPEKASAKNTSIKFEAIKDSFNSIEQVYQALRKEGLESSDLIVGIDFTKSNEWQGKHSFMGMNLHDISKGGNPYMEAFKIIAKTLAEFDNDQLIPCYGFGDVSTSAVSVFSFYPNNQPCKGIDMVLQRYLQLVPAVRLSGPTSFAPIIKQAMKVVKQNNNRYQILLLLADGGVSPDHEQETINAIIKASELPLSIIMIGLGDGPWDTMENFDDKLHSRKFDNFQFIDFDKTMRQEQPPRREVLFALRALMEIPNQYKLIQQLGLLSPGAGQNVKVEHIPAPLDPPSAAGSYY